MFYDDAERAANIAKAQLITGAIAAMAGYDVTSATQAAEQALKYNGFSDPRMSQKTSDFIQLTGEPCRLDASKCDAALQNLQQYSINNPGLTRVDRMYLARAQDLISTAAYAYGKNNSISFMQAFIPTSVQKSLGFSVSAASAGGALANNCTKNQFTCMTMVAISLDYMQHYATGNSTVGSQGVKYVLGKMGLPLTDGQAEQAYGTILAAGGTAALLRQSASVNGLNAVIVSNATAISTLERIEGKFSSFSREVGFIVDAKTGQIMTMARQPYGQANASFRFTPIQWGLAKDNWITHNHPSGLTLGIEDLAAAVSSNARGIRASTTTGTYELSFDATFASAYRGNYGGAFGYLQAQTNKIGQGIMADVKSGALVVPDGLNGLQYKGFLANEMWVRYAEQVPSLQYKFIPKSKR